MSPVSKTYEVWAQSMENHPTLKDGGSIDGLQLEAIMGVLEYLQENHQHAVLRALKSLCEEPSREPWSDPDAVIPEDTRSIKEKIGKVAWAKLKEVGLIVPQQTGYVGNYEDVVPWDVQIVVKNALVIHPNNHFMTALESPLAPEQQGHVVAAGRRAAELSKQPSWTDRIPPRDAKKEASAVDRLLPPDPLAGRNR